MKIPRGFHLWSEKLQQAWLDQNIPAKVGDRISFRWRGRPERIPCDFGRVLEVGDGWVRVCKDDGAEERVTFKRIQCKEPA